MLEGVRGFIGLLQGEEGYIAFSVVTRVRGLQGMLEGGGAGGNKRAGGYNLQRVVKISLSAN